MKNLLIYSGGMDSTVMLHQYKYDIELAVSFNYGSKHNIKEIEMAALNCAELNIRHIVIDLDFVDKYFKSDLLKSGGKIPEGHYEDKVMEKTVVPFRNGIMLSIACGLAESEELTAVMIANHAGDHAIYPDCRGTFIEAMGEAMAYGTYNGVKLLAPYTNFDKTHIGIIGHDIGVDFSKTYSCYKGEELHCGVCGTCVERKEALKGFDNTVYL